MHAFPFRRLGEMCSVASLGQAHGPVDFHDMWFCLRVRERCSRCSRSGWRPDVDQSGTGRCLGERCGHSFRRSPDTGVSPVPISAFTYIRCFAISHFGVVLKQVMHPLPFRRHAEASGVLLSISAFTRNRCSANFHFGVYLKQVIRQFPSRRPAETGDAPLPISASC